MKKEEKKKKDYRKINPTGKIPALIEGSYTMLGSGDMLIIIYLCNTHGIIGNKLYPKESKSGINSFLEHF